MQLIPAIDLRGGGCVRLFQGDFDRETRYEVDPVALVTRYRDSGHPQVHIVDLDGARSGLAANRDVLRALAAVDGVTLQVGGGLRGAEDLDALFDLGVARAVIGSLAIRAPEACFELFDRFGGERIVLALDVRTSADAEPEVMIAGWREASGCTLWEALAGYTDTELTHVLCTDVGRDGAFTGPNLALYHECVARYPGLDFQASGGVRDAADLDALAETGVAGAIAGRALLENRIELESVS